MDIAVPPERTLKESVAPQGRSLTMLAGGTEAAE